MDKFTLLEHFEKYLSTLTTKSFTDFSERLLQKLYPQEEIEIKGSIKKNNHCLFLGSLYKPQFLPLASPIDSKSLINTDLVNFKKEIKGLSKFIYLTNNENLTFSPEHLSELKERYSNLSLEVWNSHTIKQKLYQLSEPDLKYVISEFTMIEGYQQTYSSPEQDRNIINDIFAHLFVNAKYVDKDKILKSKTLTPLTEKIKLNFEETQHQRIEQTYTNNIHHISLIESLIQNQQTRDENPVNELVDMIQDEFCRLRKVAHANFPVKDHLLFAEIAKILLPPGKENNSYYKSCAKSIVIYFFEYCDIGQRTEDEIKKANNTLPLFGDA
ncbi:MAG: hypothetical protein GW805_08005 [Ignavibacteria bacterium]|nr:hypothetical protein [Ignavibacteria bacterium]OIO13818.1 MAG: hypothetical protein AUJ54_15470 [Ignavibacteria bacterium CG1_02_37_35]PIS45904.1 MAG: hypothetical protein COT22_02815 [Ignavibacteria bacterium CG08_land_8_20_14_0_20_37_9]PIX93379.1 MAG: hypothetical protein COZ25_11000 [Ignavibacteria bacterium CG_4_10_14_3_um_filter_37_18]PJC60450.1 MAG: hypothetical protein CO025_03140 [Ignavibacteria bacterium CG_4_9_14_0_2_um_filter_37_13]